MSSGHLNEICSPSAGTEIVSPAETATSTITTEEAFANLISAIKQLLPKVSPHLETSGTAATIKTQESNTNAKTSNHALFLAPTSDDTLALALASLCNALYRIVEITNNPTSQQSSDSAASTDIQALSQHTREIALIQSNKFVENTSKEQHALWTEIDKLMTLVNAICITRSQQEEFSKPPLPNIAIQHASLDDLATVRAAIDRVMQTTPKLFNQTVTLSSRQERVLDEAALISLIERLFTGRKEFAAQRASPDAYGHLSRLVDQIVRASTRSMDDQRVVASQAHQERMEGAKLMNAVERQERARFKNQDWVSKETQLINDLSQLQANLMNASKSLSNQRVELSDAKEKELFLGRVLGKMSKSSNSSFNSQTAISTTKVKKEQDLDIIMDKITKSAVRLSDQRA
ncbi:hypothetical protein HK100_005687 [Physocladia obscura]|uniref:Uncharacterized protein n=1 Tax=Physocladia obscura TaxID=109957 RepID=A0AAD5SRA5_9FUNG|nr:hypothetical protein HK100_005687 [Physocladia obscura]